VRRVHLRGANRRYLDLEALASAGGDQTCAPRQRPVAGNSRKVRVLRFPQTSAGFRSSTPHATSRRWTTMTAQRLSKPLSRPERQPAARRRCSDLGPLPARSGLRAPGISITATPSGCLDCGPAAKAALAMRLSSARPCSFGDGNSLWPVRQPLNVARVSPHFRSCRWVRFATSTSHSCRSIPASPRRSPRRLGPATPRRSHRIDTPCCPCMGL
jgi:hypothetical protein